MAFPYTWVRATEDGVWHVRPSREHPTMRGHMAPARHYVRVLVERSMWQVDRKPVEVVRGLVVGFDDAEQARFFLNAHDPRFEEPRCEPVSVVPGMAVAFYETDDALAFVSAQKAVLTNEADVIAEYQKAMSSEETEVEIVVADDVSEDDEPEAPKTKRGKRKAS